MKTINLFLLFTLFLIALNCQENIELKRLSDYSADKEWTVVGAGPAGIVAIGLLCDLGIPEDKIMWIDPEFNVGRIGQYYSQVPGNTKTSLYVSFLKACKTFQKVKSDSIDALYAMPQDGYEKLEVITKPLQDITSYLKTKVNFIQGMMDSLYFENGVWMIGSQDITFSSKHVILAVGSHPKTLDYSVKNMIPLDYALDKSTLHSLVTTEDKIAVIGSAHSAILILKFLTETVVEKIINFYTHPLTYAVDMGTWTLNNTHGLKGTAAQWAKEVLEANPPANLIRVHNTVENREKILPDCNKIIYAIGYERNSIPSFGTNEIVFDPETGVIGPRIFGIGIAFPGTYIDQAGNKEQLIGLNSFMRYAQKVMPEWIAGTYDRNERIRAFSFFEDLFTIELL